MNYRKETECLKVDINEASLLLKASKIEPFSKLIEIIKNIIKRIDEGIWNFSLPIKELEEFSTLLLLRVTTRIDKIRCSEFVTIAQEIFERIKDMPFSETVTTGILEFLGDSELLFYEEQMKKEIDCLYVRVNTLREKLNNFQLKKARNNQQDLIEESVIKKEAAETVSKQETQTNIQNVEGVEPEGLIHENTISQLSSPKPKEFIFENAFTEISSPKSIKNSEHARSFLDLNSTPRVIPEKKDHSFCLLDIYGNFGKFSMYFSFLIFSDD